MTKRFLLDTGPAFDYLFRRKTIYQRVVGLRSQGARVGIGMPGLGEIIAGVEASASREKSSKIVQRNIRHLIVWPFDNRAAYEYGKIFAELRRIGRPIQQIDIMLAAIARTLGNCTLITADSDFSAVPGLMVENWNV